MKSRLGNVLAFLVALGTAVAPAWIDPQQTWAARVALTLVTGLLLAVKTDQLVTQRNAILAGLALAGALVAGIAGRFTAGTGGAAVVGFVAAVVAQMRIVLAGKLPVAPAALVLIGVLGLAGVARADAPTVQALGCLDKANSYCVVPAEAVGWQLNLKDGSVKNGALLAGLVLQHEFGTLPVGLGMYGGLGMSADNAGSYQFCGGVSITNWGMFCVGAQRARFDSGNTAWQGMLTFAGQLTHGGTPSYLREAAGR